MKEWGLYDYLSLTAYLMSDECLLMWMGGKKDSKGWSFLERKFEV